MHIQTIHSKTHRATYILDRGLTNAENPVGPKAVSRLSPSLQVQVYVFFRRGGATNPHPFVAKSLSRSLTPRRSVFLEQPSVFSYIVQDDRELLARNNIKWPQRILKTSEAPYRASSARYPELWV